MRPTPGQTTRSVFKRRQQAGSFCFQCRGETHKRPIYSTNFQSCQNRITLVTLRPLFRNGRGTESWQVSCWNAFFLHRVKIKWKSLQDQLSAFSLLVPRVNGSQCYTENYPNIETLLYNRHGSGFLETDHF